MRILLALAIFDLPLLAQQPAFEVASIRPATPDGQGCTVYTYPGGRVHIHNCTVVYLVGLAFDEEKIALPDAPAWTDDERYDIEARPPAGSKASKSNPSNPKLPPNEEQRQMLQTLLARRFRMKFHREIKEDDVFLLTKGKSLKLQAPKDPNAYPVAGSFNHPDGYAGTNISMAQLSRRLTPVMHRPVLDRTGLSGSFDFKYVDPAVGDSADPMSATITTLNAIGLKLESSKAPVERIVVDHIEKPTPN